MSRKISDFFTKNSGKLESEINPQNFTSSNNSGQANQNRINKNVKTETEKQLLPSQKVHKLPVPSKIDVNEPRAEKFNCQICNKKFGLVAALKMHKKIHDKKFVCNICDKKFPRQGLLKNHIQNIHKDPGSFKCDICNVGFNTKPNLASHQRVHNKNRQKSLKCDKCDFATDHNPTFTRHLKTHERIIERCNKCNKILYNYINHDCRLDCKFCGKEFSHKAGVMNHIKKFHSHEPFTNVTFMD